MGCGASKADTPTKPLENKEGDMGNKASKPAAADAEEAFALPPVEGELPDGTQIIFVLGGPGSGKGTQCDKIKQDYECVHLSAGDLLRAEVKSGSVVGKKCEELMREGKLVPFAVTLNLLKKAMIESGGKFFLIDGFPRALDQAEQFESSIMPCKAVLFFDCPEEEMEKRLLKRGETSGRSDDNAETIRKRFRTFLEQSLPVKDHYGDRKICHVISAIPHPDVVYESVKQVLDSYNSPKKPTPAAVPASKPAQDATEEITLPPVEGSLPEDAQIIFVLGGPGSGKGTQCAQILEEYDCVHLSAGDLLRAEVKSGSVVGKKCEELMREGKLVPFAVTLNLLKKAMIESGGKFFLIDGFPRALDQAEQFESSIMPCKAVLFFDCPEEEMEKRLLKRGETSGRSDDNAETIRKRFRTFLEQSLPVKDHYLGHGKCHIISAVPHPKEVFEVVKTVLDKLNAPKKSDEITLPPVEGSLPEDAQIIFVLGGPGSGKGTQCAQILEEYDCVHLSAGDLLRAEVKSGSVVGKKCEELMREGKLVPFAVTLNLLKKAMIESGGKFFLIDGFPRALDQAEQFESSIMPCKAVLFFDCPEEEMEKRLLKRGETSGRSDDNAETIRKRFRTFLEQSLPVKDHYLGHGKCHIISAVPHPKEVFEVVKTVLDKLNAPKKSEEITLPPVEGSLPEDAQIIFVLGGPGSGKGTQCAQILEEYDCVHLSAGDLLRAEVKSGSVVGKKCEELMREGKLVPFAVTLNLLKKAMIESGGKFFLIDGFPRALDQAEQFESSIMPCKAVLFFDCPEEEMEKRLLKRGETSGRSDDNAETIRKRFRTFLEQSLPVKDHYLGHGKCHIISAVPHPKEVFEVVKTVLDKLNAPKKSDEITLPPVEGSLPEDAQIIFVLGGPGSGKGTQCDKIKQDYECVHLSAGDLLRAEVKSGSVVGKKCEELMREGKLVPFAVTLNLLKKAMIESGGKFFLIDGFPRALDQAEQFESSIMPCKAVLFFDCPEEEMEKRLLKRGETSGRSDDNAETIRKRFRTFLEQSLPVKDHYGDRKVCHVISAIPQPDVVYESVKDILDRLGAPQK